MVTTPIEYKTYNAYSKQRDFHKALRHHDVVLFNAGRGAGKSTAGAIQTIIEALENQPGERGLIIEPTYSLLVDVAIAEVMAWMPAHFIKRFVQHPYPTMWLTNGSEIAFRSADKPDGLRGPNRAWMWMDEPRNLRTREAFDIAFAQLRVGNRKAWLTTTPAGIFHWIYDLFVAKPIPNSTYITAKTDENPFLPADYAATLRAQYTGTFAAQELDAAFVSFEGVIYDNFSLSENVTEAAEYDPNLDVIWGVDDGYAYGEGVGTPGYHPRVILLFQQRHDGGFNLFDEYVTALELPEKSIENVLARGYKLPTLALVDSSAAELRRRLSEYGIMNGGATHPVTEGIKVVRRFICDGHGVRMLYIHPRCNNFIREVQTYRYDDRASSVVGGERKPLKMDDHTQDSARYVLYNYR